MTDLRKRAETVLWRHWRKGNDKSATQGALDAMLAFADEVSAERVAEERKRCAELAKTHKGYPTTASNAIEKEPT